MDKLKTSTAIWSFIFPIVGVVKWAKDRTTQPKAAQTALIVAGISTALWITYAIVNKATATDETNK